MARAENYNRDDALDAAMALFWRKGYHATSLKDLEGALSMKPGSIYAAFKSKDALFVETLNRYFNKGRAVLQGHMAAEPDALSALKSHLMGYAPEHRTDDPAQACMIVKTILETSAPSPDLADHARRLFDDTRSGFAQAFREAQEAGVIEADLDAEQLAKKYQANITTLRLDNHIASNPSDSRKLAEALAQELEDLRL